MRDPRSSRRYRTARAAYIAAHEPGHPCCLCGLPVDTTLPGMSAWGPTVEHRVKVIDLQAQAQTWDHLVALVCDVSMWGLAHSRCQSKQGAGVTNARRQPPSSRW